ncbi:MAG TPA: hypothetical protein VNM67_16965 [Thermoanaerobaculia bacterium]|jgi:hypothetical protein|nr:hypothetical protein [Thermoanaerobaculia bacterium]
MLAVFREIFPFLAVLYALDGLAWVGALDLLFARRLWGWSAVEGRGVRLAGILPLDLAFSAAGPVAIPTRDGLLLTEPTVRGAHAYDPERWTRLPWERISPEVEEATLRLGGPHRVRLPSRSHAEAFRELLEEARGLAPEAREKRLAKHAGQTLDLDAAQVRLEAFREETQFLRFLSWALFVLTLLLLPAVLYLHPRPEILLAPLLAGILALYLAVVGAAAFAGSRLRRDGLLRRSAPISTLLLSPISATRAVPALGRHLFEGFDPLAVAALLLPRAGFLARVRAELHGAAFAAQRGEEGWRRHWTERRDALLRLLERMGIGEAEALAAPDRRDFEAQSWCPYCSTEYKSAGGDCEDCGLPLERFS